MEKIDQKKLEKFVKQQRDELAVIKELLNTGGHYEEQYSEAYSRVENVLSLFSEIYQKFLQGELPDYLQEDKPADE